MHTVKSREDIREAYFNFGVKAFSLDTKDELIKILETTNHADDLELYVRIAVSNEHAEIDLSKKFGANTNEAPGLIKIYKPIYKKIRIKFSCWFSMHASYFLYKRNIRNWELN